MTTTELKQRLKSWLNHTEIDNQIPFSKDLLRDCLKHIEEMEGLISTIQNQRDNLNEDMVSRISTLEYQLSERDAQCAAMREALEQTKTIPMPNPWCWKRDKALSTTAGRELLERLQKAQDERRQFVGTIRTLHGTIADLIDGLQKSERLRVAAIEFINDWRKGDFELCKLAACDSEAISKALQPKEAK